MTTTPDRTYTPCEAYDCFVGSIPVAEFVGHHASLELAIDGLIKEPHWEEGSAPANLRELLAEYCRAEIAAADTAAPGA
jgi:hypothetical protein